MRKNKIHSNGVDVAAELLREILHDTFPFKIGDTICAKFSIGTIKEGTHYVVLNVEPSEVLLCEHDDWYDVCLFRLIKRKEHIDTQSFLDSIADEI